jgi:hypothetical protein
MLYTYTGIHGDAAYAMCRLARFGHNHGLQHWNAARRVLQYLNNVKGEGLTFSGKSLELDAYVDASYGVPRSVTGYIVRLGGTAIIWRSKLQSVASQSTMEAEYVALSEVLKEVLFVRQLMEEIGFGQKNATCIYEDNNACISLAKDPVFRDRAKHIAVRFHLIRNELANGSVEIKWIDTKNQIADGLTKPVSEEKLKQLKLHMNLGLFKSNGL